ncbi:MAG: phosphomannomutase/phosphoglucomutase [Xanthomonadales bacterium]|nr:phosphomannomutase/phosphoglucomutase [Xanthomonadales bacterium]
MAELKEDPAQLGNEADEETEPQEPQEPEEPEEPAESRQAERPPEPSNPPVELGDLPFTLADRKRNKPGGNAPVELSPEIFRAYDIRGVVGQSLDEGIARQVGQAIGTQALEDGAAPVVVARDGRHSGPGLVKGMIEGISSTGCDVIDIGAVPTGVLYFAAYEAGSGSGVMVTGSHNPPDYNGFKVMLSGKTLAQERITGLYERLEAGDIRIGKGDITQQERLQAYRDRIAGDIQLKRPIKVVADCGNGIGGVCAADVLRDIGAEVLPLFDDVDGDFPNHHPDPSDPHNLEDLIGSVAMMQADLGVAFDGDADRLGVVTPDGEIIYSDRLMMLFAREVLSRNPGAKIIYDVKCTGKLDEVIREAGGDPEMFKTGHSLIKNRMKEVDAPFAGEMSGHFFFKDRWYGFDCGIYSAARMLEILAMDDRTPQQVLSSLPASISTPELKVQMNEGENHEFVADFQEKARFVDARVSTIDGLRADYDYGWGLVRASNTTPILVVRFEADSEESLEIIKESFRMQMLSVRRDLNLPF